MNVAGGAIEYEAADVREKIWDVFKDTHLGAKRIQLEVVAVPRSAARLALPANAHGFL